MSSIECFQPYLLLTIFLLSVVSQRRYENILVRFFITIFYSFHYFIVLLLCFSLSFVIFPFLYIIQEVPNYIRSYLVPFFISFITWYYAHQHTSPLFLHLKDTKLSGGLLNIEIVYCQEIHGVECLCTLHLLSYYRYSLMCQR